VSAVATGGFLQRLVDEGSMPLAEAVRPAAAPSPPALPTTGGAGEEEVELAATPPASPEAPAAGGDAPLPAAGPPRPEPPTPEATGPPGPGRPGGAPLPLPAAPLRDAGIRSVTSLGGVASHGPPQDDPPARAAAHEPSPPPRAATGPERPGRRDEPALERLEDRWRDLGRRLLATHPPPVPAEPAPPAPAPAPRPVGQPPASPARAGPARQPPELYIDHMEVRLVAPVPRGDPEPARPATPAGPRRTWDAAVRRYLGRM
jgi:translation initiation factor IF-2